MAITPDRISKEEIWAFQSSGKPLPEDEAWRQKYYMGIYLDHIDATIRHCNALRDRLINERDDPRWSTITKEIGAIAHYSVGRGWANPQRASS